MTLVEVNMSGYFLSIHYHSVEGSPRTEPHRPELGIGTLPFTILRPTVTPLNDRKKPDKLSDVRTKSPEHHLEVFLGMCVYRLEIIIPEFSPAIHKAM